MAVDTWSPLAKVYSPLLAGSIDGTDTDAHDHAVLRALNSKYRPNKSIEGDPQRTLFVSSLNPNTNEETLEAVFSRYGEISSVRLVRDIVTGHSRRYAFVEYAEEKMVRRAEREADKLIVDGREIFVDFECERSLPGWIPRRLGGGFGGKKESGQLRFGGKGRSFRKPILLDAGRFDAGEARGRSRGDMYGGGRRGGGGDRGGDWRGTDRGDGSSDRRARDRGRREDDQDRFDRRKVARDGDQDRLDRRQVARDGDRDRSTPDRRDRSRRDRSRSRSRQSSRSRETEYKPRSRKDSRARSREPRRSRYRSQSRD